MQIKTEETSAYRRAMINSFVGQDDPEPDFWQITVNQAKCQVSDLWGSSRILTRSIPYMTPEMCREFASAIGTAREIAELWDVERMGKAYEPTD